MPFWSSLAAHAFDGSLRCQINFRNALEPERQREKARARQGRIERDGQGWSKLGTELHQAV